MSAKKTNKKSAAKRTSASSKRDRKTGVRKAPSSSNAQKKGLSEKNALLCSEIVLIALVFICIFLILGNFGAGGGIGNRISRSLFGFFGWTEYIFPVIFITGLLMIMFGKAESSVRLYIGLLIFFFFACVLCEIIAYGHTPGFNGSDHYERSAASHLGGGIVGGLGYSVLHGAFGSWGTVIFSLFAIMISLVLITSKPLMRILGRKGKEAAVEARRRYTERKNQKDEGEDDTASIPVAGPAPAKASVRTGRKKESAKDLPGSEVDVSGYSDAPSKTFTITKPADPAVVKTDTTASATKASDNVKEERMTKEEKRESLIEMDKAIRTKEDVSSFKLPPVTLLTPGTGMKISSEDFLAAEASKLEKILQTFGVSAKVIHVTQGPTVTRYELQPAEGVKISRIVSLQNDIKLNMAAKEIRIEAPIPGKAAVGIEVPNTEVSMVALRDILELDDFRRTKAKIAFAVGRDIAGNAVISDIEKMPHLLIAGATGSGKSVCINTLIISILMKHTPDEVRMIMIDPKMIELKPYNDIPHLLIPVVTDAKKAAGALHWAVAEMMDRYKKFSEASCVRDIKSYNAQAAAHNREHPDEEPWKILPRIIVIVDEFADLMMVASKDVEDAICRLSQLARAAGIHLVLATQRPTVDVVTGLIKANMPSRIALSVSSGTDSRTIIDQVGAEKLLGHGDMLFYPQDYSTPARVQGAFVSDGDIEKVVHFLTAQATEVAYNKEVESKIAAISQGANKEVPEDTSSGNDELFESCARLIIEKDKASTSMLQRAFKIGFNRAARIMDQLAEAGVVGEEEGTKPRKILMTRTEFEQFISGGSVDDPNEEDTVG